MITLLLLMGCPKGPVAVQPANAWQIVPRLPAPTSATYGQDRTTPPTDPPLAALVKDKPWDGALSGAAAGVALDLIKTTGPSTLTRWGVREAAWTAGYPYPIADARAWGANPDGSPPPDVLQWLETFQAGDDLGLVRARGNENDIWVGLKGHPRAQISRVPRQIAVDGLLEMAALPGHTYAIADANGTLSTGSLDTPLRMICAQRGEWLVDIRDAEGTIASFPVYVGLVPPELGLFDEPQTVGSSLELMGRTTTLLGEIRDLYGVRAPTRDYMLDAGAKSLLVGEGTTAKGVIESLSLDPRTTAVWVCENTSLEACLHRMVWHPENRFALLAPSSQLGLAAVMDAEGQRLVGILSRME